MGLAAIGTAAATALGASAAIAGVAGAATAVVGTALAASMLAPSAPSAPAAPPPPAAPAPMPTMDQSAINRATQQQTALAAATSGRQSTMLSQTGGASGSDKLGG